MTPILGRSEVEVDVNDLVVGRAIHFPMFDNKHVLLLAQGSVITPDFKRILAARKILTVQLRPEDAQRVTKDPSIDQSHPSAITFDDELTRRLQTAVESGLLFVTNRGPAVRSQLLQRGNKAYDTEFVESIQRHDLQTTQMLHSVMGRALHGRRQASESVLTAIQASLTHLTSDLDASVAIRLTGCHDGSIARHCIQMAQLSMAIATEMGLNSENVCRVGVTGLLHDWGMLRVPKSIRESTHPLNAVEILEIHKHPSYTADLLDKLDGLPTMVTLISMQVHEKLDGSGYPRQRTEQNIHLFARILHVADDFIQLVTPNGWRPALHPYAAMRCLLRQEGGRASDPFVLRCLLQVLSLFPIGCYVNLSDGSAGKVIRRNPTDYLRPIIQLTRTVDGRDVSNSLEPEVIDLTQTEIVIKGPRAAPGKIELSGLPRTEGLETRYDSAEKLAAPNFFESAQQNHSPTSRRRVFTP